MFLTEHFAISGDAGFPLCGIICPPSSREEGERFRAYLKRVSTSPTDSTISTSYLISSRTGKNGDCGEVA